MEYAKIVVKSNYDKRGDLVLRSYVRALKKVNAKLMLDGDKAFIYGVVDDNGKFHELFTNEVINYEDYDLASVDEIFDATMISNDKKKILEMIIGKVLFEKDINIDFEISSMEDLAKDRAVEFDAYDRFLSRINPYMRLSEDNQKMYNSYNDFLYKIDQLKVMKRLDSREKEVDSYSIYDYVENKSDEEEEEYLVFEVPKKLVRK